MSFTWFRRWSLLQAGAFLLALVAGLFVTFVAERTWGKDEPLRGVLLERQPVGGMERPQLMRLLDRRSKALSRRVYAVEIGEEEVMTDGAALGVRLDQAQTAEQAIRAGKSGNPFAQFGFWLARLFHPHEEECSIRVDREALKTWLNSRMKAALPDPILPTISFDEKLQIQQGRPRSVVDYPALEESILRVARAKEERASVEIPTQLLEPTVPMAVVQRRREQAEALVRAPIDVFAADGTKMASLGVKDLGGALVSEIDAENRDLVLSLIPKELRSLLKEPLEVLEKKPTDAGFEFSPSGGVTITPSETGLGLDMESFVADLFQAASREKDRRVTLKLAVKEPKLTTEDAETLGVKKLVMAFVTHHPCCQPRVENIHMAADELDGVVLRPGETFSLNQQLGPRSRASGYQGAPTIVHGEMQEVSGGGISQLATTLFNAVLRGGYEIIQRQPHSIYFSRYPEGHEATVSYPEPDLIFRNDTQAGMVIRTQYTGTFIKVLVYGDDEGRIVTTKKSHRYDIKRPPIEYEPDPEMAPEKQKRVRAGQLGWTVLVSRKVKYKGGREKVEKREVVYNPRPELIRVHPCKIPAGEEGHTGEECPEPPREEREEELSDDTYYETTVGSEETYDEEGG